MTFSVLSFLGITDNSDSVFIPQLDTELSKLVEQSKKYFTINTGDKAHAKDGNVLAITRRKIGQTENEVWFKPGDDEHEAFIRGCVREVKENATKLKELDWKIATSVVLGVVAGVLSFIPFLGAISLIGWGAALYFMSQRAEHAAEYQKSLTLTVAACNWSLGQVSTDGTNTVETLTKNNALNEMVSELFSVFTRKQVGQVIDDTIDEEYKKGSDLYNQQRSASEHSFFKSVAAGREGFNFKRCLYGYNRGKVVDIIDAIVSILPDLWHAAVQGWENVVDWASNKFSSTSEQQPGSELEHSNAARV